MEMMHFSIDINAPKQKVWETMLNDKTYRQWTHIFNPETGSYFEGDWSQGSKMRFLGPESNGKVSGMLSEIKENRLHDFLSIRHLGEISKGEEKLWPKTTDGSEFLENYTFKETDKGTEVLVDLTSVPEFKDMFQEMWPKALKKLKELAEAS